MADVRPFRALRPRNDLAGQVIAPPYDVLTDAEARDLAQTATCFVRITRAEVDLPAGSDPHGQETYLKARENLDAFKRQEIVVQDASPTYYFYAQTMGDHHQVGVLAGASVEEYDHGLIRKHEFTRPDKEEDRTVHLEALDAQVGLVFLTHEPNEALQTLTATITATSPAWRVTTKDDVVHALWPCPAQSVEAVRQAFAQLPALYIADGHHRSAAASRVHAKRGCQSSRYFLAGLFPADQLCVMAYNRVVLDLAGLSSEAFFEQVGRCFNVKSCEHNVPASRGRFTMYHAGTWYELSPKPEVLAKQAAADDPVASLDVAILQDYLLEPILGIKDPRRSTRIHFVGGIRGPQALEKAVDDGAAVAFHLYPTGLDQLFQVADAGKVMPPKSTWFEPKLCEGVVIRSLTET